jgi:hypothetical protein
MQIQVKFVCDKAEEVAAIMTAVAPVLAGGPATETPTPSRTGKNKEPDAPPAAAQTADPLAALTGTQTASPMGDPLAALGIQTSAGQLPPVAVAPPPVAMGAPVVAPASPTQQDVIKAFVTLGQKHGKGIDAVKTMLTPSGVQTVTAIKPEHIAHA